MTLIDDINEQLAAVQSVPMRNGSSITYTPKAPTEVYSPLMKQSEDAEHEKYGKCKRRVVIPWLPSCFPNGKALTVMDDIDIATALDTRHYYMSKDRKKDLIPFAELPFLILSVVASPHRLMTKELSECVEFNRRCVHPLDAKNINDLVAEVRSMLGIHRAAQKRDARDKKHDEIPDWFDSIPLPELAKRRWLVDTHGERLQEQTSAALNALRDANSPPFVFTRAATLSRVIEDEKNLPSICALNESGLRGILERTAIYTDKSTDDEGRKITIPVLAPISIVRDVGSLGEWGNIPQLIGLTECPIIHSDGTIITSEGYDPESRLYYRPVKGTIIPPIPEKPTRAQAIDAIGVIQDVFKDFPFVDDASRANCFAALISLVIRPTITGCVPMALIDKPQVGTGASLIAEVIGLIATGRTPEVTTAPATEEEWRKKILTVLMQGRMFVILDNIHGKLESSALASVLTASLHTDRILGKSENVTFEHRNVWVCTGNNIQVGGDIPRRCYWVRMDAKEARPWQRDNSQFTHPDLRGYVAENRGKILAAVLTITRRWIQAGRPKPAGTLPRFGSFEEWRDTVGGILEYIGIKGFLGNLEEMYAASDADTPQWEAFFEAWRGIWARDESVTVAMIQYKLEQRTGGGELQDVLYNALPDKIADALHGKKSFNRVLGNALAKINGRRFTNGLMLEKGKTEHSAISWHVREAPKKETKKDKVIK